MLVHDSIRLVQRRYQWIYACARVLDLRAVFRSKHSKSSKGTSSKGNSFKFPSQVAFHHLVDFRVSIFAPQQRSIDRCENETTGPPVHPAAIMQRICIAARHSIWAQRNESAGDSRYKRLAIGTPENGHSAKLDGVCQFTTRPTYACAFLQKSNRDFCIWPYQVYRS